MSDKDSAAMLSELFLILSKFPPSEMRSEIATWAWEMTKGRDFHPSDMQTDEELTLLGLARKGIDPCYPEDGETTLYGPT